MPRPLKEPGTTRFEMLTAFDDPQKWEALLKREELKSLKQEISSLKQWIPKPTPKTSGGRAVTR